MHWRTGTHNLRLWALRLRSMWHRSRLFTRPFSHAPVFLSFVLSHGFSVFTNPFPTSSQSFLPALPIWFFWCIFRFRPLYQEFGESSLPDISCVYSRVHSRIPFSLCIHYAFSDAFIRPHINDFMCFKTSSRANFFYGNEFDSHDLKKTYERA